MVHNTNQARIIRGYAIVAKGDEIRQVNSNLFRVPMALRNKTPANKHP